MSRAARSPPACGPECCRGRSSGPSTSSWSSRRRVEGTSLTDGMVVSADTSERTVRLMDAFDSIERILTAADPAQLDAALSNLAHALDGHGDDLGRFVRRADRFVGVAEAHEDTFYRDLELLDDALRRRRTSSPHARRCASGLGHDRAHRGGETARHRRARHRLDRARRRLTDPARPRGTASSGCSGRPVRPWPRSVPAPAPSTHSCRGHPSCFTTARRASMARGS